MKEYFNDRMLFSVVLSFVLYVFMFRSFISSHCVLYITAHYVFVL